MTYSGRDPWMTSDEVDLRVSFSTAVTMEVEKAPVRTSEVKK